MRARRSRCTCMYVPAGASGWVANIIIDDGVVAYGSQRRDKRDRRKRQPTSKPAAAQISRPRPGARRQARAKEPPRRCPVSVGRVAA